MVKRFAKQGFHCLGGEMVEREHGDYVLHSDHAAIVAERDAVIVKLVEYITCDSCPLDSKKCADANRTSSQCNQEIIKHIRRRNEVEG